MTPFHAALGLGAIALAGLTFKDKIKTALGMGGGSEAKAPAKAAGSPVEKLTKGRTYTVLAVVTKDITNDARWNTSNAPNEEKIAQIVASTFAQSGFQVLNKPTIRDGFEMQKAIAGEPSAWVFNGRWLLDGEYVSNVIPWLGGASFYLVPTV
jgi:hypothetical protein